MKRFLTYALCVILVLGMIPASVISAFAQGKGVAKDETQNQSIDNALNQYIPETIVVDGNIDDLGWKEWITVDSASGVWNNATVSENQKGFSYTYSIRRDHEYLYVAVNFSDDVAHDFNVYYSADNGATVTAVSFNAENKTVGEKQVKLASNGGIVEFSCTLGEDAAAAELSCYVSATFNGNKLFYPAIYPEDVDNYTNWQWNSAVSIKSTETESLPDYVNVDGMFNEAYWSQLTNFHQGLDDKKNGYQYSQGEYDLLSFEKVQYSNFYYTTSGSTATSNDTVKNNLRFKIDMRMDKNAIYGAAIVYCYHTTDDTLGFRVFVHNGNDKYKFQIWYNNTPESGQAKNSFTLYKNGNAVASELSSTTSAAGALGYGYLFRIEFRIALEDIGGVNSVEQVTASAAAWHGTSVASTGAYTHSTTNNENAAASYTFNVAESKKINLSESIGINGEIEVSVYKALLGFDDTVQGLKRADGKGGSNSGDVKQYAFTIHADYENVYGAALIEMKDGQQWDKEGHNSEEYDYELFCLWIKSNYDESYAIAAANRTAQDNAYSHVIKFYLDASGNVCARLIKVTGVNASTNAITTASIESVLGEGCTEALLKEVEAKIVKVSDLRKENGESPDKNDDRYAIEFKVPRYVLELDYDYVVKYTPPENRQNGFIYPTDNSEGDEAGKKGYGTAAIHYFVSMESYENGSQGVVGPVVGSADGNFHPDNWMNTGSATLLYNSITPQVVTDGVFSEKVWTEGAPFVNVDYSNSAVTNETDKKLAYKYKLVLGKEYLYGAAVINSAEEGTQFAFWLKPEGYENKDYRFVIRKDNFHGWQKNAGNIYIYNGYNNDIESDYLKYKVTTLNGNTYFEFKLDLDLFLTRIDNTAKIDIDYEWPEFECFVATETQLGNDSAQKQMLHPAPNNTVLKGNETAYANVGGSWDDALIANAVKNIVKLQHIAPEVIKIDGNLNDNGWDPNGWIEVSNDANATLQEGYEDTYIFQHNNPFTFKYQIRHDGEYLYVAALFDMQDEYTTHDSTKTEKGGNKPQFRIWINPKKEDGTVYKAFKYLYDVTAGNATNKIILPQVEGVTAPTNLTGVTYTAGSSTVKKPNSVDVDTGKVNTDTLTTNGTIKYDGVIVRAAENVMPDFPNGGAAHPVTGDTLVYDFLYGESEFYGYTDIVQENRNNGTTGEDWYADIENKSYTLGNEHGIICSGDGKSISSVEQGKTGTNKNAIVEFKVKMSEFDEGYGFEYRIDAVIQGYYDKNSTNMGAKTDDGTLSSIAYSLHSPVLYTEPGSAYNYWGQNFPYWCWYNGFDFADIEDSARLRNNTTPVVSLGAKICDEYYDAEYDDYTGAIRFGARYEEKYIRYLAGMDDADYWDVKDMGIVIYPADYLEGELTLETEGALYYPADNIVNWQKGTDGWSNFADYKNFVFYITIWGLVSDAQKNMDFAFRGYMTFYEGVYDDGNIGGYVEKDFYGNMLVRSYNEVEKVAGTEDLPGDYDGSQPPVEDQGGKN